MMVFSHSKCAGLEYLYKYEPLAFVGVGIVHESLVNPLAVTSSELSRVLRGRFVEAPFLEPSPRSAKSATGRRADEKDDAHARVRVLDLEVEIESLPRDISTSIQHYQIVELGLPQRSRRLEAVSRIDLNAATAQEHVASALVGIDEENFLAIEN
jgi:hypothetical protein